MNLQVNRYNTKVPTAINEIGTAISVPFYIQPTTDQKKALLNAFRVVKAKQLLEMGYNDTRQEGRIAVVDSTRPPQTPIENDLGMTEENLRLTLFNRTGLQERIVLKLQELTGVQVFSRKEVEETFKLWLDHLYLTDNEPDTTVSTAKAAPKKTTKRKASASTAAS